ncbi:sugar phosphate isomerase/epimerase [Salmonella enterica subsp. enterica]|nr:sugar phosphate isomerase/epimerase [Salmonella enterica]EBY0806095.1 sugar phosphate isomerase/epimerase [Salmonella enterica subsp. enterica serovar Berlin]ECF3780004.1 sugar phosphate isomerase/epimerase [Salmonella enterica subsp. enterica serovar Oslo]EDR2104886.1 sugar phosphate isomerase/epimerase [Salmonella enterica subsp. enterica]EDW0612930.1 sugar phosphate isomerase/epimerase [Salmonella enterica subsp. enterica serovar Ball]EGZ4376746.1 sugar phosphate isomerase/epimerase [Sal
MNIPREELLSINTATVRKQWSLDKIIDGCVRHDIFRISPWRDQVHAIGLNVVAKKIRDNNLIVSGYCRGGMFTYESENEQRRSQDDNRRAVDEAVTIGAACLVLVVGGLPGTSKDIQSARLQVRDGIAHLLEYSRQAGMPLAIEPLHPMLAADRGCINTISQANDLCDELGGNGLGIAVDVYHTWWDPELFSQIARAGSQRILAFHICDWLVPTNSVYSDRGMMGDGIIDIRKIRQALESTGYKGAHEVEIFSDSNWWYRDPDEVLITCKERHLSNC